MVVAGALAETARTNSAGSVEFMLPLAELDATVQVVDPRWVTVVEREVEFVEGGRIALTGGTTEVRLYGYDATLESFLELPPTECFTIRQGGAFDLLALSGVDYRVRVEVPSLLLSQEAALKLDRSPVTVALPREGLVESIPVRVVDPKGEGVEYVQVWMRRSGQMRGGIGEIHETPRACTDGGGRCGCAALRSFRSWTESVRSSSTSSG